MGFYYDGNGDGWFLNVTIASGAFTVYNLHTGDYMQPIGVEIQPDGQTMLLTRLFVLLNCACNSSVAGWLLTMVSINFGGGSLLVRIDNGTVPPHSVLDFTQVCRPVKYRGALPTYSPLCVRVQKVKGTPLHLAVCPAARTALLHTTEGGQGWDQIGFVDMSEC